jgi:hypothetical protein
MDSINWKVVGIATLANVVWHMLAPVVYRKVWRNHLQQYESLSEEDRVDFDSRFSSSLFGIACTSFAGWAYLTDAKLSNMWLVGSSSIGNVALGITIGQFVSVTVYEMVVYRHIPKKYSLLHHVACTIGAITSHHYFHLFALYRYVHELTVPLVGVFAQMRMLDYGHRTATYKAVAVINLPLFTALRLAVIPFHWLWMIRTIMNAPDRAEVPLYVWLLTISTHIILDVVNSIWALTIIKIILRNVRKNK